MKSYPRRIGRSLLVSLALHLSIAIALMFVTFTKGHNGREISFLEVSFIELKNPKAPVPRVAPLEDSVQPVSLPNRQLAPTVTSPQTRSSITSVSKSSPGLIANVTPTAQVVRLSATNLPVANQVVAQDKKPALAHLSVEPSATESEQLKCDLAFGEASSGVGQGQYSNPGSRKTSKQRGVFSKGVQVESASAKMPGIASLVSKSQVADADDVLNDITENVVLGGEIPPLPKGEPGGIIVGRGKDIKGRLNLARLNDPLHPTLYG